MPNYQIPGDKNPHWLDDDSQAEFILPAGYKKITDAKANTMRLAAIPAPTIPDQIRAIESTITVRRMREALLEKDGGWLANAETQIIALRAQL